MSTGATATINVIPQLACAHCGLPLTPVNLPQQQQANIAYSHPKKSKCPRVDVVIWVSTFIGYIVLPPDAK